MRRYEAAGWLRKMVGVIGGAKDLPEEPSEEDFRIGLRNGIILCDALNKVHPGAVPKVVEAPANFAVFPDGAALSVYQYFENLRNFLCALEEMGLPTFEASDLEKTTSHSLNMLVRTILSDKKHEEVPMLVESMLNKVMKEFERRIASQNEMVKTTLKDLADDNIYHDCLSRQDVLAEDPSASDETKMDKVAKILDCSKDEDTLNDRLQKRHIIVYQQQREIQELKHALHMTKAGMEFMKSQYSEEFSSFGKHLQILVHAASGYHKVLEENRKLYNQVQDLKGNIRIYCRVRPFLPGQFSSTSTISHIDDENITVITSAKYCKEGHKTFTFNKVFGPAATQEEVFSDTQPLIRSVLDGYNVCIFAYGQTGSGKTYTMSGPKELTEEVSSTALNDRSSRSHSCLTIHVRGRDLSSGNILRGCMHLVDLAGSERVDKSEVKGDRLKEAQHINKSLSALGDVISALAQKNTHVPYRNSKLTQLLQDSLGGQAKTLMFVHISPEMDAVGETISTLKFAERVATVELGAAKKNKDNGEVKELREQIASLKAALASRVGEAEHVRSTMSSPDIYRKKAGAISPSYPSFGQPMEDVGSMEIQSNSAVIQKKANYDIQELLMETHPSQSPESCPGLQKMDDKEASSGEWVHKVIIDKHEAVIGVEDSLRDWEGDGAQLPAYFYPRFIPDARDHSEQHRNWAESVATDDSDDLDLVASDSSEQDMRWQFNHPKPTVADCVVGSRIKKPQTKPIKSLHVRTSLIPSPSRKVSNGPGQTIRWQGRIPVSGGIGGKRSVSGKGGSRK
ncbi:hypothetical protein COCNU_12G002680 [Cocos nucifera]|uniref:Uncharacterized protein n=1 Tax=Cocos nucifera TaxID=13894 RepID=A0A8K0NB01_COCNU|nr:hypothetical protein COCNU_12G002680 [Cocos nucifera]